MVYNAENSEKAERLGLQEAGSWEPDSGSQRAWVLVPAPATGAPSCIWGKCPSGPMVCSSEAGVGSSEHRCSMLHSWRKNVFILPKKYQKETGWFSISSEKET